MQTELELLKSASNEIKSLRQQNEIMSARLQMFDKMMLVFETHPQGLSRGMSEDVAWYIDRHIEKNTEKTGQGIPADQQHDGMVSESGPVLR